MYRYIFLSNAPRFLNVRCSSESSRASRFSPSGMNSVQMTVNIGGMTLTGEKKTCLVAALCTTNLTHTCLVSTPEFRCEISASDRLSHCMTVLSLRF
jgi:hypothetical protein